jgi:hypothetical protein
MEDIEVKAIQKLFSGASKIPSHQRNSFFSMVS